MAADSGAAYADVLNGHYAADELVSRVQVALHTAGLDGQKLSLRSLAPLDQFHAGGRRATAELARLAEVRPGMHVLDVGGGVGGSARHLASEHDCTVTVLDRTVEYCRVGMMLSARTGLSTQVGFRVGDGQALPFSRRAFDLVWLQHASINMPDKSRLFAEARRVLRPGGRLALHEIAAGGEPAVHYPVPWASQADGSFLQSPGELRTLIARAGFRERVWEDVTADSLAWFRRRATPSVNQPLGLHLLLGEAFPQMFENMVRSLAEGRVRVIQAVFERIG